MKVSDGMGKGFGEKWLMSYLTILNACGISIVPLEGAMIKVGVLNPL